MEWLEKWWEGWVFWKLIFKWWDDLKTLKPKENEKTWTQQFLTLYITLPSPGGRPGHCSIDSNSSSRKSCGNDQTFHADRYQHSAEEGHLWGSGPLGFSHPILTRNLGWHSCCVHCNSCLYLLSYEVCKAHRSSGTFRELWWITAMTSRCMCVINNWICAHADWALASGISPLVSRTNSASSTVCGTQLALWLYKVTHKRKWLQFIIIIFSRT